MDIKNKIKIRKQGEKREKETRMKPPRQILLDKRRQLIGELRKIERELQTV